MAPVRLRIWVLLICFLGFIPASSRGQIDPEPRRLIQVGYNQPLEGRAPIAGYGFFYYNRPQFVRTNWTLRLAVAPIYLDADLGFADVLPDTDFSVGMAGGGFADTYSEIRQGVFRREESFTGHSAEISSSIYHLANPGWRVPIYLIGRGSIHRGLYEKDSETGDNFRIPNDINSFSFRGGVRMGGREPTLTTPVAFEMSLWYEGFFRDDSGLYGFDGDRRIQPHTHLFWGRTFLKYTFEESQQYFDAGLTLGTSLRADRLSTYRLGGVLPFVSEFPLSIPGYYFQEISAKKFALLNAEYSIPITPQKNWRLTFYGAAGLVDYLQGLEQPGRWHTGLGGGITYVSPRGAWFVSLIYGHGFNALRDEEKGANQVGLLFQYDFDALTKPGLRPFEPRLSPYRSRGGERIFN